MNLELRYTSGEEIQTGDRVTYDGSYARVVFISDGENEQYATGYEDYIGAEPGVMICDDDGVTTTIPEPDERLVFIDRG